MLSNRTAHSPQSQLAHLSSPRASDENVAAFLEQHCRAGKVLSNTHNYGRVLNEARMLGITAAEVYDAVMKAYPLPSSSGGYVEGSAGRFIGRANAQLAAFSLTGEEHAFADALMTMAALVSAIDKPMLEESMIRADLRHFDPVAALHLGSRLPELSDTTVRSLLHLSTTINRALAIQDELSAFYAPDLNERLLAANVALLSILTKHADEPKAYGHRNAILECRVALVRNSAEYLIDLWDAVRRPNDLPLPNPAERTHKAAFELLMTRASIVKTIFTDYSLVMDSSSEWLEVREGIKRAFLAAEKLACTSGPLYPREAVADFARYRTTFSKKARAWVDAASSAPEAKR